MTTAPVIHGTHDPAFGAVFDAFAEHFVRHPKNGLPELGAAVCVEVDGRRVVDLWAGFADVARTRAWTPDTLACVCSCTKGMVAIALHRLAERGLVDYDATVATYWPEFAAAGKEAVTVRHLLTHSAGLPKLREALPAGGIYHWDTVVDAFAAEAPHWEPGTAHGYHTLSFGHLNGEVVRRVDGRDLGAFFRDEIALPLGADFFIGTPASEDHRIAELALPHEGSMLAPAARAAVAIDPERVERYDDPFLLVPQVLNSTPWRRAQIPGANGHASARGLARIYGALVNDEGLLRRETIDVARTPQVHGPDRTRNEITEYGLGFATSGTPTSYRPGSGGFGHGGAYGSLGHGDPEARLSIGFVFNQLGEPQGDGRAARLLDAALDAL
jgi:CubicO group peptidase (beta-lactamase class C family)